MDNFVYSPLTKSQICNLELIHISQESMESKKSKEILSLALNKLFKESNYYQNKAIWSK